MLNDPIKLLAVAAAAALLVLPYLPALVKQLKTIFAALPSMPKPKAGEIVTDDLTTVLDLANRLRKDGNKKASELARQLLDAMLEVPQ